MLSKEHLQISVVLAFVTFIVMDWLVIVPNSPDIGMNLLTDSIFAVITIIALDMLFDYRETLAWKRVHIHVNKRISLQFFHIFLALSPFCKRPVGIAKCKETDSGKIMDIIFNNEMEKLRRKVEFTDSGRKYMLELDESYIEDIKRRQQLLNEIESKYLKFLHPDIQEAIMTIQDKLDSFCLNVQRKKQDTVFTLTDEEYLEEQSSNLQCIFQEMYRIFTTESLGVNFPPR